MIYTSIYGQGYKVSPLIHRWTLHTIFYYSINKCFLKTQKHSHSINCRGYKHQTKSPEVPAPIVPRPSHTLLHGFTWRSSLSSPWAFETNSTYSPLSTRPTCVCDICICSATKWITKVIMSRTLKDKQAWEMGEEEKGHLTQRAATRQATAGTGPSRSFPWPGSRRPSVQTCDS